MSEIIFWSATAWSEQINGSIYSIPKNYMWREASFDWFLIPVLMRAWKTLTTSPPSLSLSFLLLSFSHIFTSPYLNPFPHLLHKPLFLLAVSVHAPPPLHTKFPECLLQFSRRLLRQDSRVTVQRWWNNLTNTHCDNSHTVLTHICWRWDLDSVTLSYWNKKLHAQAL